MRNRIQETEEISCYKRKIPRSQRTKNRTRRKNVTPIQVAEFCGEHVMEDKENAPSVVEESEIKLIPSVVVHRRAPRKRRNRKEAEETSKPEVVLPITLRSRGSTRRRPNNHNLSAQQVRKLDTNMFDFYLENLWKSFSEEKKESFAYLDCLWFSLYTKEASKAKVLSWIKRKHIFSKKYVFVPIVRWCHWSLLIFCHFGESLQSKTRTPCMLLLDSLRMANPKRLEPGIRKFVMDIYRAEELLEEKQLISRIPFLVPKVPQQRNGDECGSFVLYYINLFLESAPENFSTMEYPYFMKEDWFTLEGFESFSKTLDAFVQ